MIASSCAALLLLNAVGYSTPLVSTCANLKLHSLCVTRRRIILVLHTLSRKVGYVTPRALVHRRQNHFLSDGLSACRDPTGPNRDSLRFAHSEAITALHLVTVSATTQRVHQLRTVARNRFNYLVAPFLPYRVDQIGPTLPPLVMTARV